MLNRRIKIGEIVDETIPLPSGIVLMISDEEIKGDYQAFGAAGKARKRHIKSLLKSFLASV